MVKGVLRARLDATGLRQHVHVRSAGTAAHEGQPAADHTIALLAAKGIDISGHRSSQLQEWDIKQADVILAMQESHRREIFYYSPEALSKVMLLSELVFEQDDLADPYGGSRAEYEATLQRVEDVLTRGWRRLLAQLQLPQLTNP